MTEKIKELRKILPVPMAEALSLLKANNGDVEKCVYLFKAKSVGEICELTGCDEKMANEYYEAEKFDFNRTVSAIREAIYDRNYSPIDGLDREAVSAALQWLRAVEADDFGVSLDYKGLDKALDAMSLIPEMQETAQMVRKAKQAKDKIFSGYSPNDSLDEFVRRHKVLDDEPVFEVANRLIPLQVTVLKDHLLRHSRNL